MGIRVREIVPTPIYQALMKRGEASRPAGSRGSKAPAGGSKAARSDLIGEITKNSPHLVAVSSNFQDSPPLAILSSNV